MIVRQPRVQEYKSYSKLIGGIIATGCLLFVLFMIVCFMINSLSVFCSSDMVQIWQVQDDGRYRQIAWYDPDQNTYESREQEYPTAGTKIDVYDDL